MHFKNKIKFPVQNMHPTFTRLPCSSIASALTDLADGWTANVSQLCKLLCLNTILVTSSPCLHFSKNFFLFVFCLHAHCPPVFSVKIVCVLDQLKPSALGGKTPALCGTGMGQNCAHYTRDFTTDTNTYKLYINAQKAIHHLAIPRDRTTRQHVQS